MSQPGVDAQDTAVIVPVVGRPASAARFMESLRGSGAESARVYAVCQNGDRESASAWLGAGANVLAAAGPSFAVKVNHAYRNTVEPWLFIVGDDVRFRPGWLVNAQLVAGRRWHVVGTNDRASLSVLAGEYATHLLIRRTYVDQQGASWDGPGVVCHEGYRHSYVDIEIVAVAKLRAVWAMAASSVVEHLHPQVGRGQWDAVYELGQSFSEQDRALWEQRAAEHLAGVP